MGPITGVTGIYIPTYTIWPYGVKTIKPTIINKDGIIWFLLLFNIIINIITIHNHQSPIKSPFASGGSADFAAPFAGTGLRYTAARRPDARAP